ncbi:hypothetical protein DFP73DRAFT_561532 [Morchella snyderi]|nr:hypothetical protein DFP73DRAFT_561532 [Morchella snyderi]
MLRIPTLARRGYHRTLKIALDHGESPNVVDEHGYSALERAVRSGSLEAVRLLLEAGANLCGLTTYDDRFTLARVARLSGNMEMEELLVKFKTRKSPRGVEE